jgi:hypothetical protein
MATASERAGCTVRTPLQPRGAVLDALRRVRGRVARQLGERVGAGSSGVVYRARFRGAEVAAKKATVRDNTAALAFLREVKVRHPSPHLPHTSLSSPCLCTLQSA